MREVIPNKTWLGHALDRSDARQLFQLEIEVVVDLACPQCCRAALFIVVYHLPTTVVIRQTRSKLRST